MSQTSLYCKTCQSQKLHTKENTNHVFHLIMSVLTGGLWIFVWVAAIFFNAFKRTRCVECGDPQITPFMKIIIAIISLIVFIVIAFGSADRPSSIDAPKKDFVYLSI